jgi:hypothetical protein
MKDKTKNTSAVSIFGTATATSANGDNGKSNVKVTSVVNITVDVAGLITKGKTLLEDESLDTSSGKFKSFQALGKELLKDSPNLVEGFVKATNWGGVYSFNNPVNPKTGKTKNEEASHKYAVEAVQRGIEFLEMLL